MQQTQRMVPTKNGKRAGIKLDDPTWQAVEWAASHVGRTWQQWCAAVIESTPETENMTAAIRVAAMESLLAETVFAGRASQLVGYQPIAMRLAGQCDDKMFQEELGQAHIESESDCGGFRLLTGIDKNGRVSFFIENGLRDASHIIVPTPFTPVEWQDALEAKNES